MLPWVPAVTDVPIEDEVIVRDAREGFVTVVTVNVLPFNGNAPARSDRIVVGVPCGDSRGARSKQKPVVLPAERSARNVDRKRESHCLACRNRQVQTGEAQHTRVERVVLGNHLTVLGKVCARDCTIRQNARLLEVNSREGYRARVSCGEAHCQNRNAC